MEHQTFKIHNSEDFCRITDGIKIAQCMRFRSTTIPEPEKISQQLEDLVVSDSLSCNFCNTVFEDRDQQRLHYKLDWHRYNLKQRLHGLKTISEDAFSLIADKDDVSSISGSESESDEEGGLSEEKRTDFLVNTANRHTKVFFENKDGHIFSIYRCLLHNKKDIPEHDSEMIAQALYCGKPMKRIVIMLGGGHFAAAVFYDGIAIAHKTLHSYTVRAKQGTSQGSRDNRGNGSHPKSAGASLRRYNENAFSQHVQEYLSRWSSDIKNSSLILYRAVGPINRTILFGGKNPPLDKNDLRLRPLPFPTRRPTFNEVKRVYDIVSSMEIYGPAANFTNTFPISPRQPIRKKVPKSSLVDSNIDNGDKEGKLTATKIDIQENDKPISNNLQSRFANVIESDDCSGDSETNVKDLCDLILEDVEINFKDDLQFFDDTVPRHLKNKKYRKKKKKERKNRNEDIQVNEVISAGKVKLWKSCQCGDTELFNQTLESLLTEVEKSNQLQNSDNTENNKPFVPININDVTKLVNDSNDEGNTMLHVAAAGNHLKIVWNLLHIGSDPCNKNKKLQTPYVITTDKKTRDTFRRFMGEYPDKFNYNKSQIPGPLSEETELNNLEKKKQQKRAKREKEKMKKKEMDIKRKEEAEKEWFLALSDREKRAVAAERRIKQQGGKSLRCFQCGIDVIEQSAFEYNANKFCSVSCLKGHRNNNKDVQIPNVLL